MHFCVTVTVRFAGKTVHSYKTSAFVNLFNSYSLDLLTAFVYIWRFVHLYSWICNCAFVTVCTSVLRKTANLWICGFVTATFVTAAFAAVKFVTVLPHLSNLLQPRTWRKMKLLFCEKQLLYNCWRGAGKSPKSLIKMVRHFFPEPKAEIFLGSRMLTIWLLNCAFFFSRANLGPKLDCRKFKTKTRMMQFC